MVSIPYFNVISCLRKDAGFIPEEDPDRFKAKVGLTLSLWSYLHELKDPMEPPWRGQDKESIRQTLKLPEPYPFQGR